MSYNGLKSWKSITSATHTHTHTYARVRMREVCPISDDPCAATLHVTALLEKTGTEHLGGTLMNAFDKRRGPTNLL